jgi:pSer/pThr/pTyr-binding forkhead associated (FHA) protein
MARLRVVSGPAAGQTVDIEGEIVIGREDTDLAIDDGEMSRRHAVVRRHANRLQVEDLGSTNGTFVDGTRIAEPTLLGGGAEIKVGTTVLVVEGVLPVSDASGDVVAPRNVTRISPAISDAGVAPASTASSAAIPLASPAAAAPPLAAPTQAVGDFRPPERARRQPGLASRSWVPVALSFGTVIIVAIALVIYFSQHT